MIVDRTQGYPNVTTDRDRHGNVRYYFRVSGRRKERIHAAPGAPEWPAAYADARRRSEGEQASVTGRSQPRRARIESLDWLLDTHYYPSPNWQKDLRESTRKRRRYTLDRLCNTPINGRRAGDLAFAEMRKRHVIQLRNDLIKVPGGANMLLVSLRHVMAYAVELELIAENPCDGVRNLKLDNPDGNYTWTRQDIADYASVHRLGTRAHLALMIAAFTGARMSDLVRLGPADELDAIGADGGQIRAVHFTPRKTDNGSADAVAVTIEILAPLQEAIEACRNTGPTWLQNGWGRPADPRTMSNRFREWCDAAAAATGNRNLERASAHGLRKAAAVMAAERGATNHQLMAVFGWMTSKMPDLYTKRFSRQQVSLGAGHLLEPLPAAPANVRALVRR